MKLTPFEKAALKREQQLLFIAAVEATQTVKELADECKTQIEYYKALVLLGSETIEERNVLRKEVDQAIHDNKHCNAVFVELANTMEQRFGINA
jgi:phosphoenolpyruvate-protein kinase (PTS system EI component)